MSKWNKKHFSVYDNDEKSVLGILSNLSKIFNNNSDGIEECIEEIEKKVSIDDLEEKRKLDSNGNFTGSWFGLSHPSYSEEGIRLIVEGHTESITTLKNEIKNKPSTNDVRYVKDSITMADLSNDVKEAMTGGSVAVVGKNAIGNENIKSQAITPFNLVGAKPLNLFKNYTLNKIADSNTGELVLLSSCAVSDFIPVNSEIKISVSWNLIDNFIAMYDSNYNFLGMLKGKTSSKIYTLNSNTKFIRVNVAKTEIENFSIIQGESENVSNGLKDKTSIKWLKVENQNLNGANITSLDEVVKIKPNLFNINTITNDFVVNINDGSLVSLSRHFVTDYIPVEQGKEYVIYPSNLQNLFALYDENKNFIGGYKGSNWTSDEKTEIVITDKIITNGYIRVNCSINDKAILIIEENKKVSSNLKDKTPIRIDGLKIDFKNVENVVYDNPLNILKGKKVQLFGDSITYWDKKPYWNDSNYIIKGYPSYIEEQLKCTIINNGKPGATLAKSTNSIYEIFRGVDLSNTFAAIITGGTNDLGQNIEIGEIGNRNDTSFNVNTYVGALREMIHRAYEQNPFIKLFLLAPIQCNTRDIRLYSEAMEKVAKMYGIPCIRLDEKVQINKANISKLTFDGTHPNNEGYEIMGDVICNFLTNYN